MNILNLGADKASLEVSRELEMKLGDPTLTMVRHSYSSDDKLVDILYCHYNPKCFQYRMSLSLGEYKGE